MKQGIIGLMALVAIAAMPFASANTLLAYNRSGLGETVITTNYYRNGWVPRIRFEEVTCNALQIWATGYFTTSHVDSDPQEWWKKVVAYDVGPYTDGQGNNTIFYRGLSQEEMTNISKTYIP